VGLHLSLHPPLKTQREGSRIRLLLFSTQQSTNLTGSKINDGNFITDQNKEEKKKCLSNLEGAPNQQTGQN